MWTVLLVGASVGMQRRLETMIWRMRLHQLECDRWNDGPRVIEEIQVVRVLSDRLVVKELTS